MDDFPERGVQMPQPQFLSDEPPRPKREPGDGLKVALLIGAACCVPLLMVGIGAFLSRCMS